MSKPGEKHKKELSKSEWLRYARQRALPEDLPYEDEFSRRAVKGLQYVENKEAAQESLQRLESRIEERLNSESSESRIRIGSMALKIAAGILLLAIPLSILWFNSQPVSSQTAFEQHFDITPSNIPLSGPLRDGIPEADLDLKRQAILDYENRAFTSANTKFGEYLNSHPADIAMRFYFGVSLLAEGEARAAIEQLEQVRRQSDVEPYRIPARWYLGLAYLKLDERAKALTVFQSLANQTKSNYYREEAEAVLRELE